MKNSDLGHEATESRFEAEMASRDFFHWYRTLVVCIMSAKKSRFHVDYRIKASLTIASFSIRC